MVKNNHHQFVDQEDVMRDEADAVEETAQNAGTHDTDNVAEEHEGIAPETEKLAEEAAAWRNKYARLQAEFDNFRKRTLKEKMDLVSSAGEDVIKALLPVVDDLDRALAAMETASDVSAVKEGVVLISNKLRDTLATKGVAEIEAVGRELDTDFHEAVAKIPAQQKCDRGKILDCVQKGYKLNDKVIRHAKVVVGE